MDQQYDLISGGNGTVRYVETEIASFRPLAKLHCTAL